MVVTWRGDVFLRSAVGRAWRGLEPLIFLLYLCIVLLSTGVYGDADSYTHFQIAKYAFKYPYLLLNLWGKPVFTLLAAPFAPPDILGQSIANRRHRCNHEILCRHPLLFWPG